MESKLRGCEISKIECILNCTNSKAFYRFPHEENILKIWLDKLGLDDLPSCISLPRICNNHFSEDMFEAGGKRLKKCAVPVFNIPHKQSNINKLKIPYQKFVKNIQNKPTVIRIVDKIPQDLNPIIPNIDIVKNTLDSTVDDNTKLINKEFNSIVSVSENTGPTIINPKLSTTSIASISPITTADKTTKIITPTSSTTFQEIPHSVQRAEIIISRSSRCFLKCKDAKNTYKFPQDEPSRKVWMNQLGLNEMPPRSTTARICRNHFSPRMFTIRKGLRLTRCAIPDMNLPGQTKFISEDGTTKGIYWPMEVALRRKDEDIEKLMQTAGLTALSPPPDKVHMNEYFSAVLDPPFVIENHPDISQPEILINSIENIKTAISQEHNKEGILHVFQPGIEKRTQEEGQIGVSGNSTEGDMECALKCTNSERLFKFPSTEIQRQVWLERTGLMHCHSNTRICDKHFSEQMFAKTKRKLKRAAYPDINIPKSTQPRMEDVPKKLNDYRIVMQDHVCDVIELPESICVLTVLKGHTDVDAVVNGVKYIKHDIDGNVPRREREVQVEAEELLKKVHIGISSDDTLEDLEDGESDYQQLDWMNMFKSHVFASKAEMFECLTCGEISVGYDCNLKHSNVHKETSSLCFRCGRLFPSQSKLKIHEKKKHLKQMSKALRCPKVHCKKAFYSKKQLHHHVEEHIKRTEYKCNRCMRVFRSALRLHSHQITYRNCWLLKHPKRVHIRIKTNVK